MSKKDLHPVIRRAADLDGWSQHADVDIDAFTALNQAKLAMYGPQARMQALRAIDEAISTDDGTTLRSKSQLALVRRRLSYTHEQLLKAGR
jgi:hypothetical protein